MHSRLRIANIPGLELGVAHGNLDVCLKGNSITGPYGRVVSLIQVRTA